MVFICKKGGRSLAKNASIIEINGNRYDAVSGQLIGAVKKVASQIKSPAGGVIDGLVRRSSVSASRVKSSASSSLERHVTQRVPGVRQRTQRAQTLMRGAVKRPVPGVISQKKSAGVLSFRKARVSGINPAVANRAKLVGKNSRVAHFGRLAPSIAKQTDSSAAALRPNVSPRASAAQLARALPATVSNLPQQRLERLLDHALAQADAHKQALKARTDGWRRIRLAPKWLSIGAGILAAGLLVGFFAWQNIPQVSMRVAAMRAHVSASVPAYTPSGFKFAQPITASDNKVTISYKADSNSSDNFAITQQASSWDSSSVAANAVPASSQVQTSQVNGTTVYIYGSNNDAKWVNHGVLFSLQDKANLSSDQILKIANGL